MEEGERQKRRMVGLGERMVRWDSHFAQGNAALGLEIETRRGIRVAEHKQSWHNNCSKTHRGLEAMAHELWHFSKTSSMQIKQSEHTERVIILAYFESFFQLRISREGEKYIIVSDVDKTTLLMHLPFWWKVETKFIHAA